MSDLSTDASKEKAKRFNQKGALFIVFVALIATISNTLVHGMSSIIPAAQLLFLKSSLGVLLCTPWIIIHSRKIIKSTNKKWHAQKALMGAVGNFFWLTALQKISLSDATTLSLTSAIFTTLGATLFFKERLSSNTVIALSIGFCGVLVTLRPSFSVFSMYTFFPLLSAICYSGSSLFVKKVTLKDSPFVTLFYLLAGMSFISAPFAVTEWVPLSNSVMITIFIISIIYCFTQILLIYAYSYAHAGFLAPFKFARFPLACLIGAFFFNEQLTNSTIVGGILIFLACILIQKSKNDPSFLIRNRQS